MARIIGRAELTATATLQLTEPELRALEALVGYGFEPFVKVFYEKMGEAYMKPHADGLRLLFESVREQVPPILARVRDARLVFDGSKQAVSLQPVDRP